MIPALRRTFAWLLGRGEFAITVPPFDGPLQPNRALDEAEVVAQLHAPEDLATDGESLFVADGNLVRRLGPDLEWRVHASFSAPVTAIACRGAGGLAVALGGTEVALSGGLSNQRWGEAGGRPFRSVNSVSEAPDGSLIVTDGSSLHGTGHWSRDLMKLGSSGRVCRLQPEGEAAELVTGLKYAFGAAPNDVEVWVSESWAHGVTGVGCDGRNARRKVLDHLPGYPSRMSPASGGGVWLTVFAARTSLVEFVLRETEYREAMIEEVDPQYWVAPSLSPRRSFLEPMQGGAVKQLGIMKPWAPPRSYGLVVRLGADGRPLFSLHSRADGQNHGIVAAVEWRGALHVLSKGARRVLRVPLGELHERLAT